MRPILVSRVTSTGYFSLLVRGAVWGCSTERCGVLARSAFSLLRKRSLPEVGLSAWCEVEATPARWD